MDEVTKLVEAITDTLRLQLGMLDDAERLMSEQNYGMAKQHINGLQTAVCTAIENFEKMEEDRKI